MELLKKSLIAIVLLFLVCLAWVGFSVYYNSNATNINPNANSYIKQLRNEFDTEELEKITERTKDSFPVQPEEFFSLVGED